MRRQEIETPRLRLRPFGFDDAERLHALFVEPDVRKYLWDDEIIPRERTASLVKASVERFTQDGLGLWAVLPKAEDRLMGFVGFWFFHEPPELELLYGLSSRYWNQGFATESAVAMMRYGFEDLSFSTYRGEH